jgi:abequosyltransferase
MSTAQHIGEVAEGPFVLVSRIGAKLNSMWLRHTYPFAEFGHGVHVDYSCEIRRSMSPEIRLGNDIYLGPGVWIDVPAGSPGPEPKVVIGNGCSIGRRCTISARNQVVLEADVLLGPSVLIMDHNHEFSNSEFPNMGFPNMDMPVHGRDAASGGRVFIGRNCWLGIGAVIAGGAGDLNIGHNSVVGANAVVTQSFPPFSVIAGNPAKLVKTYDLETAKWVKPNEQHA